MLVRVGGDDAALAQALAEEEGLLVRTGSEYGLDGYVRITVGPRAADGARCRGDRAHQVSGAGT